MRKRPADALARAETFIKEFKDNGLVVPAVRPHALYSNDKTTLLASAALGRKYGAPVIIHFSETGRRNPDGSRPVQDDAGRVPRVDCVLGAEDAGGAWRLGHGRRHRHSETAIRWAWRTTRRAT
jgi:cytosine/adenosine deaminase-related metal-dependent hydrolase